MLTVTRVTSKNELWEKHVGEAQPQQVVLRLWFLRDERVDLSWRTLYQGETPAKRGMGIGRVDFALPRGCVPTMEAANRLLDRVTPYAETIANDDSSEDEINEAYRAIEGAVGCWLYDIRYGEAISRKGARIPRRGHEYMSDDVVKPAEG